MSSAGNPSRRGLAPELEARIGALIGVVAKLLATLGGLLLVAFALMTIVSIVGLAIFDTFGVLGAVPGAFEIVSMGTAIAVFLFLPHTQFRRGHVVVEIATNWAGKRGKAFLAFLANILMSAAAFLVAWRLTVALLDKVDSGQSTFMLQIPEWWGYAACAVGAWMFVIVSAYTIWRSLNEWLGDGEPPNIETGAEGA